MESRFVENNLFSQNIVYCTTLYLAAQNGHKDIVKYISELPIDTISRGLSDFTRIFLSAQNGRLDDVKAVIDSMYVNNKDEYDDVTTEKESNEEDLPSCSTIHEAVDFGTENLMRSFIETEDNIDAENDDGYTSLQKAARNGNTKFIEVLIREGAAVNHKIRDDNVVKKDSGKTALHIACEYGHFRSASKLLSYGTDPELKDSKGNVPLYYAVKYGSKSIVQLLLNKGVNINAVNNRDCTVITEARNENVINMLLKNGLNYQNIDNKYGHSILHIAARYGNDCLVNFLLENKMKLNIEQKNHRGHSPFATAAYSNACNVMKILLKYGANIYSINNVGENALHRAACNNSIEAIAMLLENRVDINVKVTTTKQTPLIMAVRRKKEDAIKLLLSHGADVKIKDSANQSALNYAIKNNNQEIILMLRKHFTL